MLFDHLLTNKRMQIYTQRAQYKTVQWKYLKVDIKSDGWNYNMIIHEHKYKLLLQRKLNDCLTLAAAVLFWQWQSYEYATWDDAIRKAWLSNDYCVTRIEEHTRAHAHTYT
jgi:hypothetical protein